jgi:hypothetical protein
MQTGVYGKKTGFRFLASFAPHCGTLILPKFMREIVKEDVDFFHNRIKTKAAPSVERTSKSPKKRFFARLYWSEENSLFIRREKRQGLDLPPLV